jgi:hypothetical protein
MTDQEMIRRTLDLGANLVSTLPPAEWAPMVVYFLHSLDTTTAKMGKSQDFDVALRTIQDRVDNRYYQGTW